MAQLDQPGSIDVARRRLLHGSLALASAALTACGAVPAALAPTPTTGPALPAPTPTTVPATAAPAPTTVPAAPSPPPTRVPVASTPSPVVIVQPATPSAAAFMERAVAMRQTAVQAGDQAYGAVVVKGDQIVGLGPSQVITRGDPTAHAEMEAIRDACRRLGTRDLSGCVMYSTSRPCRMCEAASVWANIGRLYFGDAITDGGAPRLSACS